MVSSEDFTQKYRVVVTGRQLKNSEFIKTHLMEVFDLPENQLNALLSGKPLVIKKNIQASAAMKFKKALTQCGLECLAEPMDEESIVQASDLEETHQEVSRQQVVPHQQEIQQVSADSKTMPESTGEQKVARDAEQQAEQKSAASAQKKGEFLLAPVGARIGPRAVVANNKIPSVDHLSADYAERLAEEKPEGPSPPDVDHIRVAPVGADLGEKKQEKRLEIDLSHLQLDEPDKE